LALNDLLAESLAAKDYFWFIETFKIKERTDETVTLHHWHLHPFGQPEEHQPTPEGMSPRPATQFLTEVEKLLVDHGLI
jgi:hypothetical protein